MKNKLSKIFISLVLVSAGFLFFSTEKAEAACVVNQANFRVVGPTGQPIQIPPNSWYRDTNPPFVYIDFATAGCTGATNSFLLSIVELDDTNGLININDNEVTNFINRPVVVPSGVPNFTIVTRAGDNKCDSSTTHAFQCEYYISINHAIVGGVNDFSQTSNLKYNCDSGCDNKLWEYVGILTTNQGAHPDDIAMQNAPPEEEEGGGGVSTGGQDIDINIINPIGPSNMTIVDVILKIMKFAITVGIPLIAIAIIYSGLLFVTARGNDKQLETAKNAFTFAVIGGGILLGSWIFAKLIKDVVEGISMVITYFA